MILNRILQISKVSNVIKQEITRLKNAGFSQNEVSNMVYNRCYIKSCLEKTLNLCLIYDTDDRISRIAKNVDDEIKKQFYTEFDTDEYVELENITHNIDIPHTKRKYGKTWETKFENVNDLSRQKFQTGFETTNGKMCNLNQIFFPDGTLVTKCDRIQNKEEQ